jgi:DNA repair protein SbcD/Mre11
MNFRFLHAADLHLGSPLQGLAQKDEGVARRLASASRAAFEDLVTKALEENVAFAVIAGDIFDGDWKDASIGLFFNRQLARLSNRGVSTYFLRGNHDAESVVTKSLPWPDKVVEFSTRRPETRRIEDLRVALHGRGFPKREVGENYALDYPAPVPGWFNIGVLHTACGRTGHENYAPCTPVDLAARGYDYWALGHVHAFEIVSRDPWIVYSGNLQGRSVRECGERGAVIVEVAAARVTDVRRVLTDRARWAEVVIDAGEHGDEQGLLDAVEAAVRPHAERAEERLLAVRVTLAGAARLNARWLADPDLRDKVEAAAQRCSEDVWLERLRIATSEPRREAGGTALAELDLAASLDACAADPDLRAHLMETIGTVKAKLPGGMREDPVDVLDIESILADARALTLGRAA